LAQGCYVDVSVMQTQMITDLMGLRERALSTPGKISDGLTPYTPMDRDRIFQVVKSEIYEMLDDMSDPEAYAARKIAEHVADQKKGKQR